MEGWRQRRPGSNAKPTRGQAQRWRRKFRDGPGNAFPGPGKRRWGETQVAQLERKIGQQTLEIDFLKGCLQRIEEQRQLQAMTGKPLSSCKSKLKGNEPKP
jgi:transposase